MKLVDNRGDLAEELTQETSTVNGNDSRYSEFGLIPKENIVGKVIGKLFMVTSTTRKTVVVEE